MVSGGVQSLLERLKEKWRDFCEKNGLYFSPFQIFSLIILFALLLVGISLHYFHSRPAKLKEITFDSSEENTSSVQKNQPQLVVHVCGAVSNPGVYVLSEGSRVYEAIQEAGGETKNADIDSLNLARLIKDGERIYVPRKGEVIKSSNSSESKLDLNSATFDELEKLPGIGEELAKRKWNIEKKMVLSHLLKML